MHQYDMKNYVIINAYVVVISTIEESYNYAVTMFKAITGVTNFNYNVYDTGPKWLMLNKTTAG